MDLSEVFIFVFFGLIATAGTAYVQGGTAPGWLWAAAGGVGFIKTTYNSVLKTVGNEFTSKNLNLRTNEINQATIPVATGAEVVDTIKVMGGEDWYDWMKMLKKADLLADNCISMAYSYVGPELTFPVYYNGTIGMAKKHLAETTDKLTAVDRKSVV